MGIMSAAFPVSSPNGPALRGWFAHLRGCIDIARARIFWFSRSGPYEIGAVPGNVETVELDALGSQRHDPLAVNHRRFRTIPGVVIAAVVSSIALRASLPQTTLAEHPINSVREIRAGLRRCWVPPPTRIPPQLTVRLSLKRNGEILGQPLISYTSPDTSEDERAALHAVVVAAIAQCTPLPISDALGAIIAGRPINVRLGEGWRKTNWHR